jgi:hypothetical protein
LFAAPTQPTRCCALAQELAVLAIRAIVRSLQRLAGEGGEGSGSEPLYVLDTHLRNFYQDPVAKIDLALSATATVSLMMSFGLGLVS